MQADFQAGKVSLNPVTRRGELDLRGLCPARRQDDPHVRHCHQEDRRLKIDTYMGEEKDVVTLQVQMASLPDGTSYESQTVLNATAKQLVVTTTNSNYQKIGGN